MKSAELSDIENGLELQNWKETIILLAGPLADVAYSSCQLVGAVAFKDRISLPAAVFLGGSSAIWITGELMHAALSAIEKDAGDFGEIAGLGKKYLRVASISLVSCCALGVFAALQVVNT
jgi:hypothetical protein